ncbi:MAG: 4Fe-4S dicluster domain-containing protein [Candidatus Sericytochromatia bacterium]|nr:4Fe-4S dicluster domain-containing protein [Candidatus Sericytochromatia bacterium]
MLQTQPLPFETALAEHRFFKVICGASYRNYDVIRWLAEVFTHAGAHAIDVGLDVGSVEAAVAGIRTAQAAGAGGDPAVMVSLDAGGDVHFFRIRLDRPECTDCGICLPSCRFGVFDLTPELQLEDQNCTGCRDCLPVCPTDALSLQAWGDAQDYAGLLEACWAAGARAIELHTGSGDEAGVQALWRLVADQRARWPLISFSVGDYGQGTEAVLALIRRIVGWAGSGIIIQVDGKPISGRTGVESTLPALELAARVMALDVSAFVQVAGGTNDLTGSLARERSLPIHGVGMGSFARAHLGLQAVHDPSQLDRWQSIQRARELVLSVHP